VLSDPDTRRRYDAFGPDFRQVPADVDPETWARATRARRAGRAPTQDERVWVSSGFSDEDIDFEDLLSGLFGERGRRGWGPITGADQEAELVLSVEDAYRGARRSITLPRSDGSRTLEVTIPAGVVDGQRIRLAGQGGQGTLTAQPGDLYLIVRLAPHPRYRVAGRDIFVDLPLTPWEAALGAAVAVETPGGEVKVRVRPGTSTGKRLRLKGRGMPNPRGAAADLFAEVRIMVPTSLSEKERELFKELATISTFDPRRGS
jgi:curved DNA-binding protein